MATSTGHLSLTGPTCGPGLVPLLNRGTCCGLLPERSMISSLTELLLR